MKCLEVTVNSETPVVVGDRDAGLLSGSIGLTTAGSCMVTFSAYVETSSSAAEHRTWLRRKLAVGDELRIRVVESSSPTSPGVTAQHGESADSSSPLLSCSMCRRSRDSVARLISGGTVSICDECVALCVDSLAATDAPPGEGAV